MSKNRTSQIVDGHGGPSDYVKRGTYCYDTYVRSRMYIPYFDATRVFCTYRSSGDRYCTYKIVSMCFSSNSSVGYLGVCVS